MTATAKAIQVTNIAANAAADKLAENLVALDVTAVMPLTDVFLLASGRTERQVSAIADGIEEKMLELKGLLGGKIRISAVSTGKSADTGGNPCLVPTQVPAIRGDHP